jgi:hypothetical protein
MSKSNDVASIIIYTPFNLLAMFMICTLCQQCSHKRKTLTKMFRRHQCIHYTHAKKKENQLVQCWTWTIHSFPNHTVKTKIIFQCLYTEACRHV